MEKEKYKHSGLGITSCIIGMICILMPLLQAIRFLQDITFNPEIINIMAFLALILNPIGSGLGIAAILQKNRKKLFSILGLALNIPLTIFGTMVILGIV